ncbi:MAG: hypothetical protein A2Z20_10155 [Bdellovibrionales bacterium RBG_16_40_8]|nr:MAG: hypothetical protein A2Z20_10155 [Bdellovibrionales bacterium RBG_16_40_8]
MKKNTGQILVEACVTLALFLLFIFLTLQLCQTGLREISRFRLTKKETYENKTTKYRNYKKTPTVYDSDIYYLLRNNGLARRDNQSHK